jgi:hypothetical protein
MMNPRTKLSIRRWLGLDRAADFLFALRDALAAAARKALTLTARPRRPCPRNAWPRHL